MDRLKDAFSRLPAEWQVWLTRLGTTVAFAAADAIVDAVKAGEVAPTRESVAKALLGGAIAGWVAGKLFAAQSPMPRRAWTWAERQAEAAKAAEKK